MLKFFLENYIKGHIPSNISTNELSEIINCFLFLKLNKNDFLVKEGSVCKHFCFIETGILQHAIMVEGVEKTTYLGLKNSATTALNSFKNNLPSRKNIKALSDCTLWVLTINDFKKLLEHNATFKLFYHHLIENQILLIDDYRIDLLTLSPEQRYSKLLKNEPTLIKQVPLQHLSSSRNFSKTYEPNKENF